ncbi:hypothetical protein VTK26DRAFT_6500 [Humicola hyalothermophila]
MASVPATALPTRSECSQSGELRKRAWQAPIATRNRPSLDTLPVPWKRISAPGVCLLARWGPQSSHDPGSRDARCLLSETGEPPPGHNPVAQRLKPGPGNRRRHSVRRRLNTCETARHRLSLKNGLLLPCNFSHSMPRRTSIGDPAPVLAFNQFASEPSQLNEMDIPWPRNMAGRPDSAAHGSAPHHSGADLLAQSV